MRVILFTGKGGVGKTTTAAATALRLADQGVKTLVISTDSAHSLADALDCVLGDEPSEVLPGLDAVQIDTQRRFSRAWDEVQRFLTAMLTQGGLDPISAEELTVLPGIEEVLALLAVRDLALSRRWDALVLDCAPTAETLRLLALPEALNWYLRRTFGVHRNLARGMRPIAALLGGRGAIPPDSVFDAVYLLADELATVRELLVDPEITSVRLVLTPEAVVTAEARRTFTALALYGYRVDEIVANRIFPTGADGSAFSSWQRRWVRAQAKELAGLADSFAGVPVRRARYLDSEPVGAELLRSVALDLYGAVGSCDPAGPSTGEPLLTVAAMDSDGDGAQPFYQLTMRLPLAARGEVAASRAGEDLVVTVGSHRRVLTLPSVLRRCVVAGGSVDNGRLVLRFRPDPALWPERTGRK